MRWRPILKEFSPELKYIKGENKVVASALYRLEMSYNQEILNISEIYWYDDAYLPDNAYPIRYHNISRAQKTDTKINQKLVSHKDYTLDTFCGGDHNHHLIYRNRKICLPAATKDNCRLVSQYSLSTGRDSHRIYPPSTSWLERFLQHSPQRV